MSFRPCEAMVGSEKLWICLRIIFRFFPCIFPIFTSFYFHPLLPADDQMTLLDSSRSHMDSICTSPGPCAVAQSNVLLRSISLSKHVETCRNLPGSRVQSRQATSDLGWCPWPPLEKSALNHLEPSWTILNPWPSCKCLAILLGE